MEKFDVVGIGNALVDVIVHVDEETLKEFELQKSVMHPVSAKESQYLLEQVKDKDTLLAAGGSIANSLAGVASFGNRTAFIGSVGIDQFADIFIKDLDMYDVVPHVASHMEHATGHAIIFVTPDGERTFATHVGAAAYLTPTNINKNLITAAKILYIEGYVLAHEEPRKAALHAAGVATDSKVKVAIDMSNVSVVREHGEYLKKLIEEHADIVFANSDEARAYTGKEGEGALAALGEVSDVAVVTMHDEGSMIQAHKKVYEIPAVEAKVVNVSGAGDIYAAAILHGIVQGLSYEKAGQLASYFAARAVEMEEARLPLGYVQTELKKEFNTT